MCLASRVRFRDVLCTAWENKLQETKQIWQFSRGHKESPALKQHFSCILLGFMNSPHQAQRWHFFSCSTPPVSLLPRHLSSAPRLLKLPEDVSGRLVQWCPCWDDYLLRLLTPLVSRSSAVFPLPGSRSTYPLEVPRRLCLLPYSFPLHYFYVSHGAL